MLEKVSCHGFPSTQNVADAYGCLPMKWDSTVMRFGHQLIGNSQTLPNMVVLRAAVLACIGFYRVSLPPSLGPTFKLGRNALDEFTAVASPWYDAGIEIYCRLLGHVSPSDGSIDVHTLWFDGQKGVGDSLGHSIWTKAIPKNVF